MTTPNRPVLPVEVIACDHIPDGWFVIVGKTDPITGRTRVVASRPDGSIVSVEIVSVELKEAK